MIKIENLNKSYGNNIIYKNASYYFKTNSITCFYGESGSGKTTLFNMLAGFDCDFEGNINANGVQVNKLSKSELSEYRAKNIGFVFQNYYLLKGYTALENVLLALYNCDELSDKEKEDKALNTLKQLDILEEAHQKIETLSGGQKQRVSIARALVNNPSIILTDEPTGALDIKNSEIIMNILKEISKEKTVIIITHDEEILKYADEVVKLEDSTIKKVSGDNNNTIKEVDENNNINRNECFKTKLINKKYISTLALKNIKINKFGYILSIIMLAVSVSSFISSFSMVDISNKVMDEFKQKNKHYSIGQVDDFSSKDIDYIYNTLSSMENIEDIYRQGNIKDIVLKQNDKVVELKFNSPSIISTQTLSYGHMPNDTKNEIVLSASLANMINEDIKGLIDKEVVLEYKDSKGSVESISLKITGITNNTTQNFILSSDIEKQIYKSKQMQGTDFDMVKFKVKELEDIKIVTDNLESIGISSATKYDEIAVLNDTFSNLTTMFTILSYLIFVVGVIISSIVLHKILDERKSEIAVLGAIGYSDKDVNRIIKNEIILSSIGTIVISILFVTGIDKLAKIYLGYGLDISILKIIILIAIVLLVNIGITSSVLKKILKKDKSMYLR